jgi:hypothetical protein
MTRYNDDGPERGRVYGKIAPLIMQFYRDHSGQRFHVEQLRRYVESTTPDIAPDSPGRILRELRLEGKLNYVVLDRRASLYQFRHRVKPPLI